MHFNITPAKNDLPSEISIQFPRGYEETCDTTFTLSVGALTPMAAKELYESLEEAPPAFLEVLAHYFFETTGQDINEVF